MKYPVDIERAMDEFILRNPNAGWRAILAAFDKAMMQSMREDGELFEQFAPRMPAQISPST